MRVSPETMKVAKKALLVAQTNLYNASTTEDIDSSLHELVMAEERVIQLKMRAKKKSMQ